MIRDGSSEPSGKLYEAIENDFGSFPDMVQAMIDKSLSFLEPGWCWLGYNKELNRLQIVTCSNEDPLWATHGIRSFVLTYKRKIKVKKSI